MTGMRWRHWPMKGLARPRRAAEIGWLNLGTAPWRLGKGHQRALPSTRAWDAIPQPADCLVSPTRSSWVAAQHEPVRAKKMLCEGIDLGGRPRAK